MPTGVIGLGDLGGKLTNQILQSGGDVVACDPAVDWFLDVAIGRAIDPSIALGSRPLHPGRMIQSDVAEVLGQCRIVHWAVPSHKLHELSTVPGGTTVVLHDSVMGNSQVAVNRRDDADRFVIAHCLMNSDRRVLVSPEFGSHREIASHFISIGLAPKNMRIKEHDQMMARTQGVFALLIQLELGDELNKRFADGDLTPSAMELRAAVMSRESRWTKETVRSILANPELKPFVAEMASMLVDCGVSA